MKTILNCGGQKQYLTVPGTAKSVRNQQIYCLECTVAFLNPLALHIDLLTNLEQLKNSY